jgi:ABC-type branched-subunit amino acid transport system substrate-binding protein
MRALAALLVATVACTSPAPAVATPTPTPERGVLTVSALLDLTGPRAAVGIQQRNALTLWTEQRGRSGMPVKVQTVDVASSDAKLLIELKRAATDEMADAAVVGAPLMYDETIGRAIELGALPVLLMQPTAGDPALRTGGRWAFAIAPSMQQLAALQLEDALRRDVLAPSVLLSGGRERIDPMQSALTAEAERRGIVPVTPIALASDGSVPPVVRSGLSVIRSVHCFAPIAACSAVAKEAREVRSPTMIYLPWATSSHDHVRDDRDLAARAVWPGSWTMIAGPSLGREPAQQRQAFLRDYASRSNAAADTHAGIAFDAITLLASAAQKGGADDRASLRDALEAITMPLIAGSYSFSRDRHLGRHPGELVYFRWDSGAPAIAPTFGTVAPTPTPSPTPARAASPSPTPSP